MSDFEPKRKLEHDETALDSSKSRAFDTGTRNVESAQVKAAENANPDRHSGSAGGDQEHSLEIVGFGATVSRKTQLTEKDLPKVPTKQESPKSFYATESADKKHLTLKGGVEEVVITPQAILERIGSLSLDKQTQIVGTGIVTFQQELDHQKYRIFVGAVAGFGDAAVSLTEGVENLGKSVCAVAEFSRELATNDPAAIDKAAQAKEAAGKLLVGCVGLFTIADSYLGNVGATGDYTKPFRDIAWLGQKIDERWQAMSPEEKTRVVTKAATENLAGLAVGLGTTKLAKSMHVVEALEQLGKDASQLGGAARAKSGKFIESMLDELLPQPMGVTPDGHLMPIPRTPKDSFVEVVKPKAPNENVMLSQADDLNRDKTIARAIESSAGKKSAENEKNLSKNIRDDEIREVAESQSGVETPKKFFYVKIAENKIMKEPDIVLFGGQKKLEQTSLAELSERGLQKFEWPELIAHKRGNFFTVEAAGQAGSFLKLSVNKPGEIIVNEIFLGSMPEGLGNLYLSEGLKLLGELPTRKLTLQLIVEEATLASRKFGDPPERSLLGKCASKALSSLGIKAEKYEWEEVRGNYNIVITTRR